jgi:hypothetical protein
MIDLLFIEIGAVVTEILGPNRCTIEPYCHPEKPPTYDAEGRVEVDFALSLAAVLGDPVPAAMRALYDDQIDDRIDKYVSRSIGPDWPGGAYEGIVSFREDVVKANATLAAAVATLPGRPWEYQVVVSVNEATGDVRRYHGFHAEVDKVDGDILVLRVAHAGRSADPSARVTVRYDPAETRTFYAGALVAENLVRSGRDPRNSGAVFIGFEAAVGDGPSLPKLPPGADL